MADTSDLPAPSPAAPRRRWWLALLAVLVIAGGVWAIRRGGGQPAAGGPGQPGGARPVPVTAATVARRDVPTILEGLGNVVAFRTVTVRSQVDGRLDQVLFKEGQPVTAGQLLAQIDPRPFRIQLQQGEGALARDGATLGAARLDLERYRTLVKDRLVSQQQVDAQAALVGQLEGTVRIDQASVETARLNLDYARVTSPIAGVTGIRQVDAGNLVRAADAGGIVLVTQLDPVAVIFTLPQDVLAAVSEAMSRGPLAVEVRGRDGTAALGSGNLELVDNQINQATSTLRLKAVVPNPRRLLWPNQFVKVRLALSVQKGALVVPVTALQRGPAGAFVYAIGPDDTATVKPVEVASTQGELAVLANGLAEGERVVVDGQNALRPGSKVAAREPGKAPPGQPGAPEGAKAEGAKPGGRGPAAP